MRFERDLLSSRGDLASVLDHLRWLAAMTVVVGHVRNTIFLSYPELREAGLLVKAFYFATNFHFEAVMVFFVISGVLVGGKNLDAVLAGRFAPAKYAIDRFTRIYTGFLPAALLSAAISYIPISPEHQPIKLCEPIAPGELLGNLLFVQGLLVANFCNNKALWSMANEFWYYALFPLAILAVSGRRTAGGRIAGALFVLAVVFLLANDRWNPTHIVAYGAIWALGILVWVRLPVRVGLALGGGALIGALVFSRAHFAPVDRDLFFLRDVLVGAGVLLFLMAIRDRAAAGAVRPIKASPPVRFGRFMASFSFSLYLVHLPVIWLLIPILSAGFGVRFPLTPDGWPAFTVFAVFTAACVAAGLVMYALFERHTFAVRAFGYRVAGLSAEGRPWAAAQDAAARR